MILAYLLRGDKFMQYLNMWEIILDNITYLEYAKLKCLCQKADNDEGFNEKKNGLRWQQGNRKI